MSVTPLSTGISVNDVPVWDGTNYLSRTAPTGAVHASSHISGATDALTLSEYQVTNLTTDLAGKASTTHASTHISGASDALTLSEYQITNLTSDLSGKASTTHAATHISGASDALTLSEYQVTSLITDLAGKASTTNTVTTGMSQYVTSGVTYTWPTGIHTNFNADKLDYKDSTEFSTTGHTHISSDVVGIVTTGSSPSFYTLTTTVTGVAPFTVSGATVVTNLNADMADGYHFTQALTTGATPTFSTITLNVTGPTTPMTITSTGTVTNLNADMLDNQHSTQFLTTGYSNDFLHTGASSTVRSPSFLVYSAGGYYNALDCSTGAIDYSGASDAAPVIQGAINDVNSAGGGLVLVKAGVYNLTSKQTATTTTACLIMKSYVHLKGEFGDQPRVVGAQNATYLFASGISPAPHAIITSANIDVTGTNDEAITISDLTIDGYDLSSPSGAHGIFVRSRTGHFGPRLAITRCAGDGIHVLGRTTTPLGYENQFNDVLIYDCNQGFYTESTATDAIFSNCIAAACTGVGTAGFTLYGASAFLNNCHSHNNTNGYGFTIRSNNNMFTNCEAGVNGLDGFYIFAGAGQTREYETFTNCWAINNGNSVSGASAAYDGFRFLAQGTTGEIENCVMVGCKAFDDQTSKHQVYGVRVDAGGGVGVGAIDSVGIFNSILGPNRTDEYISSAGAGTITDLFVRDCFDGAGSLIAWSPPLEVTNGGTALSSIATGGILYATGTSNLVRIAPDAANQVLLSTAANDMKISGLNISCLPLGGYKYSLGGNNAGNLDLTGTQYATPVGNGGLAANDTGPSNSTRYTMPHNATCKNLYAVLSSAPTGSGNASRTITVRLNGVNTVLTVPVVGTATSGSDTANSFTANAFQQLSMQFTCSGTNTAGRFTWGFEVYPTS